MRTVHRLIRVLFLMLLLLFLVLPVSARSDQLIMKNGDIITGKITRVEDKDIEIKPVYTQKFVVKREAVSSIVTDKPLEIEMLDGRKINARFAGMEGGNQILVVEEGVSTIGIEGMDTIGIDAVYKAAPPRKFYKRESHADALITLNEGNTQSRSSLFNIDTRLRLGDHRQYAKLTLRRDENAGVSTKKQNLFTYEYDWLFRRNWYLAATALYERDPIRDLNHRFTIGTLLGHDFIDSSNQFLTFKAGAGYTDENLGDIPDNGPVGLWELEYRYKFGSGRMEFLHEHTGTYQHYGNNNMIFRSSTGLRLDVLWDIYATASYRYNYESEPAPGKVGKDSTLAFGLGARF